MVSSSPTGLLWCRRPFGQRVTSHSYPYFVISHASDLEDGDTVRRGELAALAGLEI
jgi:hypothetical protein